MKKRPEYDLKLIGKNLKRLRKEKGFTVEDVREYLCLGSVQAVYKYENGQSYPPTDTMFALMELYEAELHDIVCVPKKISYSEILRQNARLGQRPDYYYYDRGNMSFILFCESWSEKSVTERTQPVHYGSNLQQR